MAILALPVVAAILAAVFVMLLRLPARRLGLLDQPGGRKRHAGSVPLTGGIAMMLSVIITVLIGRISMAQHEFLLAGGALLLAVGVVDDWRGVSPVGKLAAQAAAAWLMAVPAGVQLVTFGNVLGIGPLPLGPLGVAVTIFAAVSLINGINMFDGIDGLAGGIGITITCMLAAIAGLTGNVSALEMLVTCAGALAGFLIFNIPLKQTRGQRAFMGDSGALVLGFVVVWFTIDLSQHGANPCPPVVMLWVVAIVLFDLFTVTLRRAIRHRPLFRPDRQHLHHLLMRRGHTEAGTVAMIVAANSLSAVIGITAWHAGVPEPILFAGFLVAGAAYVRMFLFPTRRRHQRRR